jgi:mono/diheme cytochrome c family protein
MLSIGMLLAACGPASVADQASPPAPTAGAAVATILPTIAPTNTPPPATPTDMPAPTDVPVVDQCIECHTDKDELIDTADPVLEVVSENEGEG